MTAKPLANGLFLLLILTVLLGSQVQAQDPTVVDSAHYSVEFENDNVRVIRIKYGPGDESVMHYHPSGVAVFLTDGSGLMTLPDGSTVEMTFKAGDVIPAEAGKHQPKNTGDQGFEVIQIELKGDEESSGQY